MLPKTNFYNTSIETPQTPSKTYKLNLDRGRIESGSIDGTDAVAQSVWCVLNTERFEHIIYSQNYGIELAGLIGKRIDYVMAQLKTYIEDALLVDERITSIDNYAFERYGTALTVYFTVNTIYGAIDAERKVIYV